MCEYVFFFDLFGSWGRRDIYQPEMILYWVEKEVSGTYEKEVRRDNTRSLKMDMTEEGFDDNATFGEIDGESEGCAGLASDDSMEPDDDDDDDDSHDSAADRKRKSKTGDERGQSRRRNSFTLEDPLEAWGRVSCHIYRLDSFGVYGCNKYRIEEATYIIDDLIQTRKWFCTRLYCHQSILHRDQCPPTLPNLILK